MGEKTPDAIEIQCTGCGAHFRLTPKKGRLPSGDVPCPKCSTTLSVSTGRRIYLEETESSEDSEPSSAAPAFGVIAPRASAQRELAASLRETVETESHASTLDENDEDKVLAKLKAFADATQGNPNSTFAGLPGNFEENPFSFSRSEKTTALRRNTRNELAAASSVAEEESGTSASEEGPGEGELASWSAPITSNRLIADNTFDFLQGDHSEATLDSDSIPDPDSPAESEASLPAKAGLRATKETAENETISRALAQSESSSSYFSTERKGGQDQETRKSQLLARIKSKALPETSLGGRSTPKERKTAPSIDIGRIQALAREKPFTDDSIEPGSDPETESGTGKASLAVLFKKAKKRRESSAGLGLPTPQAADVSRDRDHSNEPENPFSRSAQGSKTAEFDRPDVEISEGEIAELVSRTSSGAGVSPREDKSIPKPLPSKSKDLTSPPALPIAKRSTQPTKPILSPKSKDSKEPDKQDNYEYSGLFAGFESTPGGQEPADAIGEVSQKRGQNTTQSMLARLQRRRSRGPSVEALEIGGADERRGSGYIRLPTAEIQEILGQGDFRLRIQDVIYEPVNREGLVQLIKSGVLMGAEELAEADGDWMPVSEHPVFGELRRKMAAEAHNVLSRLGTTQRMHALQKHLEDSSSPDKPNFQSPKPPSSQLPETQPNLNIPEIGSNQELEAPKVLEDPLRTASPSGEAESSFDYPVTSPEEESKEPAASEEIRPSPLDQDDLLAPSLMQRSGKTEEIADNTGAHDPAFEAPLFIDDPDAPAPEQAPLTNLESAEPLKPLEELPPELPSFSEELSNDLPQEARKKKSNPAVLLGALLFLFLAAGASFLVFTEQGEELLTGFSSTLAVVEDGEKPENEALQGAIREASKRLLASIPSQFSDRDEATQWAIENPDSGQASALLWQDWEKGRRDREFHFILFESLLGEEEFHRARQVALSGRALYPEELKFEELHRRGITKDEALMGSTPLLFNDSQGFELQGLYDLASHRGIVLDDETRSRQVIIKPELRNRESLWRTEVAAYRLCELIQCHFQIFETLPALLTREFLEGISGDNEVRTQMLAEVQWQQIESEGVTYEAAFASVELRPRAKLHPFPIEFRTLWLNWLRAGANTDFLAAPLKENLDRIESFSDGQFHESLLTIGDRPTLEVAREVSSLLLFDYLTNNWERFFTRAEDYGTNNPIVGNRIVSLHNGEAFQPRASRRVQGRFEWTSRFSKSTIGSLRSLERELVDQILFPQPNAAERARLEMMWSQRADLLRRVDSLIDQHGEEDVLLFP